MFMSNTMDSQYGIRDHFGEQEKDGGLREITKVNIDDDERLLPDITWAQKPPNISNLRETQIQSSAEACFFKRIQILASSSFCYLIMTPTWATHYGGMGELYKRCIYEIECINQMPTSS